MISQFLILFSISAAEVCFIIPFFFFFCIRKRLQYTELSLRGMHEAKYLRKAGTIGSWSFLSKTMNLGRASIWELNYFTPTWNLYYCKAKTECLLDLIGLIFSRSARILIPCLKGNYKSVLVDSVNLTCIFLWKVLILFLFILSSKKLWLVEHRWLTFNWRYIFIFDRILYLLVNYTLDQGMETWGGCVLA